jgi:23S rRNA pseudouridine1911/1915/1917 synthase
MSATAEIPQAFNSGWVYRERIPPHQAGRPVSCFYATRYRHTDLRVGGAAGRRRDPQEWRSAPARCPWTGDRLAWHRPPWQEPSVPATWQVIFDDGDLYVIDKPSGLPVLPAGGFLEHTVLRTAGAALFPRAGAPPCSPARSLHLRSAGLRQKARHPGLAERPAAQAAPRRTSHAPPAPIRGRMIRPQGIRKTYLALLVPRRSGPEPRGKPHDHNADRPAPPPLAGIDLVRRGGDIPERTTAGSPAPLSARSRITLLARGRADG